jgi:4-oxalocrotonate tautomerase
MPLVQVHMASGRTDEQKRLLLQRITQVMHETVGAPIASIRVWISEFEPTEFIAGGEILADRRARLEAEAADASAAAASANDLSTEFNEEGTA